MVAMINFLTSTIARESSVVVPLLASPEVSVTSTKAFSCQLTVLLCLVLSAGRARGTLGDANEKRLVNRSTASSGSNLACMILADLTCFASVCCMPQEPSLAELG